MKEDDPTVIIIMVLIICIMIGGGLGYAYKQGYIGGDDDVNQACSEYTCPTGYAEDSTATDTLCSSSTCTIADKDTCCNLDADTLPTCTGFDCSNNANSLNATPGAITCSADPCTETECCSVADISVDPACTPNPCLNGGVCTGSASGYTCACAVGFSGATCADTTSNDMNCVGSWSDCSSPPCELQTYSISIPQSGTGSPCGATDGETQDCNQASCQPDTFCSLDPSSSGNTNLNNFTEPILSINYDLFVDQMKIIECKGHYKNDQAYTDHLLANNSQDVTSEDSHQKAVLECPSQGGTYSITPGACSQCEAGYTEINGVCSPNHCHCTDGVEPPDGDPMCDVHGEQRCISCTHGTLVGNACIGGPCESIQFGTIPQDSHREQSDTYLHNSRPFTDWMTAGCNTSAKPDPSVVCIPGWTHNATDGLGGFCNEPMDVSTPDMADSVCGSPGRGKYLTCVGDDPAIPRGSFNSCGCQCNPEYSYEESSGICQAQTCVNPFTTAGMSNANVTPLDPTTCGSGGGMNVGQGDCLIACEPGNYGKYDGSYSCEVGGSFRKNGTPFPGPVTGPICSSCNEAYIAAQDPSIPMTIGQRSATDAESISRGRTISQNDPVTCSINAADQITFDTVTCASGYKKDPDGTNTNVCISDCEGEFDDASGVCMNPITGFQVISHGQGALKSASKFSYSVEKLPSSSNRPSDHDTVIVFIKLKEPANFYASPPTGNHLYKINFGEGGSTPLAPIGGTPDVPGNGYGVRMPNTFPAMSREQITIANNEIESRASAGFESLISNYERDALISVEQNQISSFQSIHAYSNVPAAQGYIFSEDFLTGPSQTITENTWPTGSWINLVTTHWTSAAEGGNTFFTNGMPRGLGGVVLGSLNSPATIPDGSGSFSIRPSALPISNTPGTLIMIAQFTIPSDRQTDLKFKGVLIGGTVDGRDNVDTTARNARDRAVTSSSNVLTTAGQTDDCLPGSACYRDAMNANATENADIMNSFNYSIIWQNDPTIWGEAFDITIPSCSGSGECFANIGESCGKQNDNKNDDNKNNLLNMNNTHKHLLFVLLIIIIFFLFKDKM